MGGEGKGWKGMGREMEGLLIRGGEKGEGGSSRLLRSPPGPRGARIVTEALLSFIIISSCYGFIT